MSDDQPVRRLAEALAEIRRAPLPFVLLGFTYAAYFLTGLIAFFTEGGVSESEEWRIFIVGWPTVSLAGPAAALLVAGLKRARYAEVESFYPLLLAANALCWVGYFVFHFPPPRLYEYEIAERALYPLVWLVPLANLLAFFALDRGRHLIAGINTTGVYALLPIAALYVGLNFSGYQIDNPELLAKTWWPQLSGSQRLFAALALAFIALLSSHLKSPFPRAPHSVAVDATVLLATVLLVFDTTFAFEDHHYNFYLGPVNDILRGKTLLADINCQYGVGVIYALALFFKLLPVPLNYQGFSLLLNVLLILQYALAYLLMRRVLGSQSFAVAALLLIVAANYFSQTGPTLPSTGPLRFGVAYALLAVFAFRTHWRIARYALVGLASLWSFESFTYTLTAYACAELYLLLQAPHRLRRLPSLIGGPAVAVAVGHLFLALFTYLRAGAWPEWSHYFEYLALYSVGEFGTLTVEAWRPWALFIAVYFLSLLLLAYRVLLSRPADAESSAFIAGLTGFGIVQFTYFLGRSHHNNLYHICIPLVFIATYWLLLMRRDDRVPKTFARSATYCYFVAGFVLLAETGPGLIAKWQHSPLSGAPAAPTPWSAQPYQPEVNDALILIERYAADRERIALFLHPERTTETLMLSQKSHIFPISNPKQDDLLPSAHARALDYEHQWQPDDYLFIARDTRWLTDIQRKVLNKIMQQMQGLYADSTEHVYAIQLSTP